LHCQSRHLWCITETWRCANLCKHSPRKAVPRMLSSKIPIGIATSALMWATWEPHKFKQSHPRDELIIQCTSEGRLINSETLDFGKSRARHFYASMQHTPCNYKEAHRSHWARPFGHSHATDSNEKDTPWQALWLAHSPYGTRVCLDKKSPMSGRPSRELMTQ